MHLSTTARCHGGHEHKRNVYFIFPLTNNIYTVWKKQQQQKNRSDFKTNQVYVWMKHEAVQKHYHPQPVPLTSAFPKGFHNQYPGSHQHVQAWTPVLFMVWWNCLVICQCFCFLTPLPFTVDSWVRGHPLNERGICGDPWKGTRREQKTESPWLQRQRRQTQGPKDHPNHLLSTMTSFQEQARIRGDRSEISCGPVLRFEHEPLIPLCLAHN